MEQYVNKSDIAAEIKRIMDAENQSINSFEHHRNASEKQRYNARMALLEHILSFLNTLEVKKTNSEFLKKHFEETPQKELDKEWNEIEPLNNIGPDVLEYADKIKNG